MLKNKFAVITGGSDGIGLGIAEAFAQNGANLLLISRNEEKLQKAKEKIEKHNVQVSTFTADLSVVSEVKLLQKRYSHLCLP